ncbi:MAG: S8 family serine peptidase [Rhodothermales bacterium]|nr:S8 family serine peptidase [Rhodothermales bacterium]
MNPTRLALLTFSLLTIAGGVSAQSLSKQESEKVDVRLRGALTAYEMGVDVDVPRAPSIWRAEDGTDRYGVIVYTDDSDALRARNIRVNSEHDGFVTVMASARELADMARLPGVRYIDAGEVRYPDNDVAAGLVGASLLHNGAVGGTEYKGDGVIVCVYDSGVDITHEDFRDPVDPTKSRFLYVWDQTLTPTGGEATPAESCCTYGVEYSKTQIEDEIDGSPAGFVRETDINGHGTHVIGTAAGNGSSLSPAQYVGMAPNADLIMIKGGDGSFPSSGIIDGFSYCDAKATAAGKPVVMNLSLGSDAGPHDGTDPESIAADAFSAGAGRLAVYSAGNSGDDAIHTSGTVANASSVSFTFTVPAYTPIAGANNDDFTFDLWFSTGGAVTVTVDSPASTGAAVFGPGSSSVVPTADGTISGNNRVDSGNGDRTFRLDVYDSNAASPPASGTWVVHVSNTSGSSMDYHGWEYDELIGDAFDLVPLTGGDSNYTLSTSSSNSLIVASYVHRWRWCGDSIGGSCVGYIGTDLSDDISSFSSVGPTRDGRQKPDIAAPGQGMISALSKDMGLSPASASYIPGGKHYVTQGTSMSSPAAAGAAALLFQADPSLTAANARSLITSNADTDGFTGGVWNANWGHGRLNIFRSMVKLVDNASAGNREILAYDEWSSSGFISVTFGIKVAVRFTAGISGDLEGVFIHPRYPVTLSGPLTLEIWTNSGVLPASIVGSAVSFSHTLVKGNSWNYIDLSAAGVAVSSGTDYHLVLYPTQSGDTLPLWIDTGSIDNRSSADTGGGWVSQPGFDFRIRPVVADGTVSLPVELAVFEALTDGQDLLVRWQTASETDNAGFGLELKAADSEQSYREVAFTTGAGTSTERIDYEHRIVDVAPGAYLVRLRQVALDGTFEYSPEVLVEIGVEDEVFLAAPYPNPFNPRTSMQVAVAREQHVRADVFDATGRRVVTLMDDDMRAGVTRTLDFDASGLATGLYFIRVRGDHFVSTEKVLLIK